MLLAGRVRRDRGRPSPPPRPPPPSGTGLLRRHGEDGVGASLDLSGQDPVSQAVDPRCAPGGEPGAVPDVGVASVVNEAPSVPGAAFVATLEGGGAWS